MDEKEQFLLNVELVRFFCSGLMHAVDRGSYFESSSNHILTPTEGMSEVLEAFAAYQKETEQTWGSVSYALRRAVHGISRSVLNRELIQNEFVNSFIHKADEFEKDYRNARGAAGKKALLSSASGELSAAATRAFEWLQNQYPEMLTERILALLSAKQAQFKFEQVAKTAMELAALYNSSGRSVPHFSERIKSELDSAGLGEEGEIEDSMLRALLFEEPRAHMVATVMTGAYSVEISRDLKGKTIAFPGPIKWPRLGNRSSQKRSGSKKRGGNSTQRHADADLAQFCFEHWKSELTEPCSNQKVDSQVVVWEIDAWDAEQARQMALDKAESVMDRVNAEYRTGDFGVKRKALVWECGARPTEYITDAHERTLANRIMRNHESPNVQRSLRFASRAAGERAGAMAVFFGWVALEYLGRSNESEISAQNFIAKRVPKVIAVATLQHLANEVAFSLLQHTPLVEMPVELRSILNLKSSTVKGHVNQRNLLILLIASKPTNLEPREIAALSKKLGVSENDAVSAKRELEKILSELKQFDQYRIRKIQELYRNPNELAGHISQVRESADVCLQRMRFVRNQTAHSTIPESLKYGALSQAMNEILDTCYQVIDHDKLETVPHRSLESIARRFDAIIADLESDRCDWALSPHLVLKVDNQHAR